MKTLDATLSPTVSAEDLLLEPRKERIEQVLDKRTRTLAILLDRLEDPFNMAAALRTSEGLGLQEVHILRHPQFRFSPNDKVTQGCDKWLDLIFHETAADCIEALHRKGFRVLASALPSEATTSKSIYELEFGPSLVLAFGNERYGVSKELLDLCDGTFWIPMRGFSQSFNVSAAVSASLNHAIAWRCRHLGQEGDLTEIQREELRQRFYQLSVKQRHRVF